MWKVIVPFVFLLLSFFASYTLAKVVSCEGFVKTKIPGIDLSRVQAKLFTNHGNLKYETECNAQNGHFLIPIYNKGHYVIRVSGPSGWIFSEPNSQAVEIADDGTGCADDIIIELVGFEIVGEVLNEGGAKLSLGLYTEKDGVLVATTETDGRGQYKFSAKPGVYAISTMTDAGQCVARGTVSVEVINGPVKVQPDITLAGHNLRVTLADEWGNKMGRTAEDDRGERGEAATPVPMTVVVELHSDSQIDFRHLPVNAQRPHVVTTPRAAAQGGARGWTYALETRAGTALFACLPSARYTLSAVALLRRHGGGATSRVAGDVQFERKTVQVGANAVEVSLSVSSFRLFGNVLDPLGRPLVIDDVSIVLDGVARPAKAVDNKEEEGQAAVASPVVGATTFVLDELTGGRHRIGAAKEHYEFGQIVTDVSTTKLADGLIKLHTERIAFCGTVSPMTAVGEVSIEVRQLLDDDGDSREDRKAVVVVEPDGNGRFCQMLRPAKYTARVLSSTAYTPQQQPVDLTEKPLIGVKFTQFLGKISGRIVCVGDCDNVSVQLFRVRPSALIGSSKPKDADGTFEFARIAPSDYNVRIVSTENVWWDSTEKAVKLVDKDMDGLRFAQKGFKMDIRSTHPTKMEYSQIVKQNASSPSSSSTDQLKIVHLVSGLNTLFFPSLPANIAEFSGSQQPQQQFKFALFSCHEFGIVFVGGDGGRTTANDANEFLIPGTRRIDMTAKATLFPVRIEFDNSPSTDGQENNNLMMHMVDVTLSCDGCSPQTEGTNHSAISDTTNGTARTLVFRLDQQKVGTQFVATAHSARHLFIPESIAFNFDGTCQERPLILRAHLGKFIEGQVIPAISEVNVTATRQHSGDGKATELHTQTDGEGKFRIGPVWDEHDFALTMDKEGFEFKPYTPPNSDDDPHRQRRSPFVFSATKLSQLVVHFVDSELKTPLSDVLVSVSSSSSSSDFRSNTVTDQTGTLSIVGLAPGTYFIRPILKEYKFATNSFSAQIAEGQTAEMLLEAKRYAYSIYGKVSTISSKMLPSPIYVEALSAQCENHQEDDMVDSLTSEFRVRGLKPSCRYKVFLKDENGQRISAFPPLFNVQTGTDDKRDVEFVVFPAAMPEATVAGELDLPANVSIAGGSFRVLLRDTSAGQIVQEQIVHGTVFFFTLPAYHRHFAVEIDRSEAKRLKIEHLSEEFFADSPFTFIRLIPRPQQRSIDVEVHSANYIGLALILLLTLAFLNQTKAKFLVAFLMEKVQKFVQLKNKQSAQQIGGLSSDLDRRRRAKKQ